MWQTVAEFISTDEYGVSTFDLFVNSRFYRRVRWNGVNVSKVETIPRGSPIYFPSITEMENACINTLIDMGPAL